MPLFTISRHCELKARKARYLVEQFITFVTANCLMDKLVKSLYLMHSKDPFTVWEGINQAIYFDNLFLVLIFQHSPTPMGAWRNQQKPWPCLHRQIRPEKSRIYLLGLWFITRAWRKNTHPGLLWFHEKLA